MVVCENEKKEKIYLFEDQFISGLSLITLSKIISKVILKREYGIFNLGSIGQISKKNLAYIFFNKLGKKKLDNFESIKVNKLLKIKRSNYMGMNCKKFSKKFSIKLPKIENEIKKTADQYKIFQFKKFFIYCLLILSLVIPEFTRISSLALQPSILPTHLHQRHFLLFKTYII